VAGRECDAGIRLSKPEHAWNSLAFNMVLFTFASTTMVAPFGTRQATSSAGGTKPGITKIQLDAVPQKKE